METNGETKRSQKNSAGKQRRTGKLAGFEIPGQAVFDVVRCLGASVRAANLYLFGVPTLQSGATWE